MKPTHGVIFPFIKEDKQIVTNFNQYTIVPSVDYDAVLRYVYHNIQIRIHSSKILIVIFTQQV